jgi:hypothetical protein
MAATAQDLYRAMVRDSVAPRLRAMGWKGSGQKYVLPDARAWVLLSMQLSRGDTASLLRFTVNISVIGKDAWVAFREEQPTLPARPLASRYYGPTFFWRRIGDLLPADEDIWWEVAADHSQGQIDRVADEVCGAMAEYAMPEIRRLIRAGGVWKAGS